MPDALLARTPLELRPTGLLRARATPTQEYFYYTERANPANMQPSSPFAYILRGRLDPAMLERSLLALVERHGIFRTALREVDGRLEQFVVSVGDADPFVLEQGPDCSHVPESGWADLRFEQGLDLRRKGLDVDRGQMIRGRLTRLGPDIHLLMLAIHKLAWDIRTRVTLPQEIFGVYARLCARQPPGASPLQYIDYVDAMQRWFQTDVGRAHRAYWRDHLRDAPPQEIPTDFPRDAVDRERDALPLGLNAVLCNPLFTEFPAALHDAVGRFAAREDVPRKDVYLAAYLTFLHRITGRDDLVIETTHIPWESQLDTLPVPLLGTLEAWTVLRVRVAEDCSFADLARQVAALRVVAESGTIEGYYELVPHRIRRTTFQDHGAAPPTADRLEMAPGLTVQHVSTRGLMWDKPWDFHLSFTYDKLLWGGVDCLFKRETMEGYDRQFQHMLATLTAE